MRAIEKQMLTAISSGRAWKRDNTEVVICLAEDRSQVIKVELFGNTIATLVPGVSISLTDAGWRSTTTKARLNAICSHFGLPQISQRKSVWYQGDIEWLGEVTWSLAKPEPSSAVLGGTQKSPRPYDAVLGGLE